MDEIRIGDGYAKRFSERSMVNCSLNLYNKGVHLRTLPYSVEGLPEIGSGLLITGADWDPPLPFETDKFVVVRVEERFNSVPRYAIDAEQEAAHLASLRFP